MPNSPEAPVPVMVIVATPVDSTSLPPAIKTPFFPVPATPPVPVNAIGPDAELIVPLLSEMPLTALPLAADPPVPTSVMLPEVV